MQHCHSACLDPMPTPHLLSCGGQQNLSPIEQAIDRRVDSLFPTASADHGALFAGRLVRGRVAQGRAAGHWPPSDELWSCPGAAHGTFNVSLLLGQLWIQYLSPAGSKGHLMTFPTPKPFAMLEGW